ncbi:MULTISPECIES: NUDIX domain-containing protein [Erwinia]|uniref:NUDIX hydrolase n=1 Tax=Erwinia pyrifoliae TaxID=79967 RepID=A0ABY5X3R0_ERWPY|nr:MULTISPECIES: NUDIX hydrolase [Erwinia]AUX72443.1 NUDIX hydrolase [Erwinia pyrifoliae]MCA8877306.1 NUDIX hydrolase [Erwinia pyrifoliae]MCT2388748.1 NUDIX hydrolase [Erwinia pyrifoliae]MCU8586917.1 NUDIX hydrolase [Erwinia pyrifoliae]UWS30788.1 NUDIX hydrolase [Erwinia pyrifoliae]
MFKPHVTVATVVQAEGRFLVVEERVRGRITWNQPAGHLEADETLLQAAVRELSEETGLDAVPQAFLRLHQWIAPDNTPFLRFLFALDLPEVVETWPQDRDIDRCWWLPAQDIISSKKLRSPLVAESLHIYQNGVRYPLDILSAFQWPFSESADAAAAW